MSVKLFNLKEEDIKPSMCVCCRHFPDGDLPDIMLGSYGIHSHIVLCIITPFFVTRKDLHPLSSKV